MGKVNTTRITTRFYCLFLILIPFMYLNCTHKDHQKENSVKEEKILLERINDFNQAFKENDVERLESMITDSYLHTNGNSKSIDKSSWVQYLNKRKKDIETGDLIVDSYEMEETEIRLYGNVAILTAKVIVVSTRSGDPQKNEFRVTNVWVNEAGNWKRAGFHDGKIK